MDDLPDYEESDDGELIAMPGDESDVTDTDDGGAIVRLDDADGDIDDPEFYANLAEDMDEGDLSRIAQQFIDLIGKDKDARKRRDEQYEEGLRRTGLGDDAPGGASFQGASKVVHPMLTEACVDFAARAMKELFPPEGPVKDFIPGKVTDEKVAKAERKTRLMNWQLTVQCPDFRAELEQLMTQVPLGGAQYLKLSWDERRKRPNPLFVAIDDMLLPFAATNFYSAQRKTHVQYLTQLDFEERVKSGMYRDVDISLAGMEPEQSSAGIANDKIEGREQSSYNEDGLRTIYEIAATAAIGDDDEPSPYLISIDKPSGKVLAIYRNWDEDDESREELQWYVEFPFIPWRGAYPIGLPQMIGGLSAAATGALRALLDAAHISNSQTMLKLKGGSSGGQSLNIQPTQVVEVEGGFQVDDIRKLAMPLPYNPPSPVLFQLLGFLIDTGKNVVRTSMEDIADQNPNAPVGTTLAKLEQGAVVYSSIHARLHDAMARMLRILHRLNATHLSDEQIEHETGEELATKADFEGPLDVVPVSDPNIFSETQRYAQVQAIAQRAQLFPQLYNVRKVEERILETLKIPNAKDLLLPATEPKEQNAVNENVTAALGKPITAFPEQDHIAHLKTHLSFMNNPMFGANPMVQPVFLPAILQHLKEHVMLWYASEVFDLVNHSLGGEDIGDIMKGMGKEPEARKAMDQMLAEASMQALQMGDEVFKSLPPVIQQAQQIVSQLQQQAMVAPHDPKLALEDKKLGMQQQTEQQRMQLEQQQTQQDGQIRQQELQIKQQELGQQAQTDQQKLTIEQQGGQQERQLSAAELQQNAALAAQHEQHEDDRKAAELQIKKELNTDDNATAMQIAAAEMETGGHSALSTGTGINPNP